MKLVYQSLTVLLALTVAFSVALLMELRTPQAGAASFPGGQAAIATTSVAAVTGTASTVFATSSACAARMITTQGSEIRVTFSDYAGQSPTATFGHNQPASTTVAYDGGIYGCGLVKVFSYSNQTLTVSETR